MDPSGPSEKAPAATYSPTSNACSTIGSGGLNCRVRDGNGCDPTDKATGKRAGGRTGRPDRPPYVMTGKEEEHRGDRGVRRTGPRRRREEEMTKPHGRLVPVSLARCRAYTPGLLTSWSLTDLEGACAPGDLVLRWVSRLDAFSGYPIRPWLPSDATGVTTGAPEGRPSRSSRTKDRSSQVSYAHSR